MIRLLALVFAFLMVGSFAPAEEILTITKSKTTRLGEKLPTGQVRLVISTTTEMAPWRAAIKTVLISSKTEIIRWDEEAERFASRTRGAPVTTIDDVIIVERKK